jgi:hypothetical protein
MNNHRRTALIAAAAAAAVTTAAVSAGASGQTATRSTPASTTISLVEHDQHFKFIDVAPKGGTRKPPSTGDEFVIGGKLTEAGKAAGTSNLVCTMTQPGTLSECVGTLVLHGGTISVNGVSRLTTNSDQYAIVGGTGNYTAAKGVLSSAQGAHGADNLTVQLAG